MQMQFLVTSFVGGLCFPVFECDPIKIRGKLVEWVFVFVAYFSSYAY